MTAPSMIVYLDYVCPYCLLAEDTITTTAAEYGVEVDWRPFELRPAPSPTLRPEDDYLPRVWQTSVYPMAEQLGVKLALPTISPQPYTHVAFEGFQYAREHGRGHDYHSAVLRAFFCDDRDIGQIDVLTDIAASIGVDPDRFRTALLERRYADAHQHALAEARAQGVRAVPTVFVGPHRIEGVPTREQLTSALIHA